MAKPQKCQLIKTFQYFQGLCCRSINSESLFLCLIFNMFQPLSVCKYKPVSVQKNMNLNRFFLVCQRYDHVSRLLFVHSENNTNILWLTAWHKAESPIPACSASPRSDTSCCAELFVGLEYHLISSICQPAAPDLPSETVEHKDMATWRAENDWGIKEMFMMQR